MNIQHSFTAHGQASSSVHAYKCLTVNEETGQLRLGNTAITLPTEQAELIGAYIYLTNIGHRKFSNSTLIGLTGFSQIKIYDLAKKIRKPLSNIRIAPNITAESLILKDIMRDRLTGDEENKGLEKRANSLNTGLIDLIDGYGFDIPAEQLSRIRTEPIRDVSRTKRTARIFQANLGRGLFPR